MAPVEPKNPADPKFWEKTCGQCHRSIEQDYWEGIHGKLAARGEVDVPVCFAGVRFRPGDTLYADLDGVVVLPA